MTTPVLSNFSITGYFNPAAPPTLAGSVVGMLYWYEGLTGWTQLGTTPPTVPLGTAFHLAVQWLNQSAEAISGHIELTITRPDGTKVILNDVLNQNNWAAPGNGWGVQFEPVILDQVGTYKAAVRLSSMGQTLDERSINVATAVALSFDMSITNVSIESTTEAWLWSANITARITNPYNVPITHTLTIQYKYSYLGNPEDLSGYKKRYWACGVEGVGLTLNPGESAILHSGAATLDYCPNGPQPPWYSRGMWNPPSIYTLESDCMTPSGNRCCFYWKVIDENGSSSLAVKAGRFCT